MLPGPDLVIACPFCKFLIRRTTLRSGNTFGAVFWSDGKIKAPMLPQYSQIIKCIGCKNFYWINDAKVKGEYNSVEHHRRILKKLGIPDETKETKQKTKELIVTWRRIKKKIPMRVLSRWEKAPRIDIEALTLEEYIEAVKKGVADTVEREIYLRKNLWWVINNKVRWELFYKDLNPQLLEYMDFEEIENNSKLSPEDEMILKKDNLEKLQKLLGDSPDEKIMKAEINRQLGNFEKALELLTDVPEKHLWIAEQIKEAARNKITTLLKLKT